MRSEPDKNDIVGDLEDWLGSIPEREAKTPREEIDLVRRAIAEINWLREKLGERSATETIPTEELNASNDE